MKQWPKHSANWNRLGPPLRPAPSVIQVMKQAIPQGNVLMLGVTPEIYQAFDNIQAVDRDQSMIDRVWLGDTQTKKVTVGQWMEMDWPDNTFSGIVGDCAIPMLGNLETVTEFQQRCYHWLKPGGTVAFRLMERPEQDVTIRNLIDAVSGPATMNFHAFKWRMGQCVAAWNRNSTAASADIRHLFQNLGFVKDHRGYLCYVTGWDIDAVDSIDLYENATQVVLFALRQEYQDTIPPGAQNITFTTNNDYDLADYTPILTWSKPL